ncbi:unnamed protein product [Zymoseptoria tritici ST99CH_1E4]|uniref:Uncharacterized protein n=1 Tax=Zymoseptoria tritici ST99CH_1E4 TaxID=1276532 RepID=A0A2H1H862_ZYMTR|nr:unnamed protein product [Zymoseptoria tritici ST99CH_1E4]
MLLSSSIITLLAGLFALVQALPPNLAAEDNTRLFARQGNICGRGVPHADMIRNSPTMPHINHNVNTDTYLVDITQTISIHSIYTYHVTNLVDVNVDARAMGRDHILVDFTVWNRARRSNRLFVSMWER